MAKTYFLNVDCFADKQKLLEELDSRHVPRSILPDEALRVNPPLPYIAYRTTDLKLVMIVREIAEDIGVKLRLVEQE